MATTTKKSSASTKDRSAVKKQVVGQNKTSRFDKNTYIKWYKDMLLWRKFEEKTGQLYIQQKFGGFCHLYIGQEAVLAGVLEAIKPGDKMITGYRDHVQPIGLGMEPKTVMAELYGRRTGSSKGKGGSMHFFDKARGLFGGHGIVGGQIGLGAGMAFADKYKGNQNVSLSFFGDGAARQGILHETFNLAMLWKLPVVFIIENNQYAMGTSVERTSNVHDLDKLGLAYDMPSERVDGMSPEAVCEAVDRAVARGRRGDGPTLLDIRTYRYKGHSMSDPQKYRSKEEVQGYAEKDPIIYCLNKIKANNWMTEEEIKAVQQEVKRVIEEAVEFAENSPYPDASELYEDVYVEPDYPFVKD